MKTSRLLALTFLVSLLTLGAVAQTNSPPASTLWDFLTTGSNYWAVPYASYSTSGHGVGGGVAVGYKVTEIVRPVVRVDYFGDTIWMASLTAELQAPRSLMGKIPVIPFAIAGGATPFAGDGVNNGTFVTILGAGGAVKLDILGTSWIWKHSDIVLDFEHWIGLPQKDQNQIRFGMLFKL